mmetsp:Transcript_5973/g.10952  ORF Transcript_5973/g.10952 Transcript_5973/m.10952 type:complete len:210 (-) Transcript_5973:225-854(-)
MMNGCRSVQWRKICGKECLRLEVLHQRCHCSYAFLPLCHFPRTFSGSYGCGQGRIPPDLDHSVKHSHVDVSEEHELGVRVCCHLVRKTFCEAIQKAWDIVVSRVQLVSSHFIHNFVLGFWMKVLDHGASGGFHASHGRLENRRNLVLNIRANGFSVCFPVVVQAGFITDFLPFYHVAVVVHVVDGCEASARVTREESLPLRVKRLAKVR